MSGQTEEDVIVKTVNLTKKFTMDSKEIVALDGVNLTLKKGEILGVTGASGAGKSTLLQLLGGLDRPSSGQVFYKGRNIFELNERELASFRSRSVGFVFQSSNLLPEFTAEENVALAAMIAGSTKQEAGMKAKNLLDQVGLANRLDHRPGKLSGGEQQRVAIARAMVNGPDLVLTDEPTGNLDTRTGAEIMKLIFTLNRECGHTFVIVTHNPGLADSLSRVVNLIDGKFVNIAGDMLE